MNMIREATERGIIVEFPRQHGKYTYIRTLGVANTSVICLAEDRSGQKYALKIVSRDFLVTEGQLEFFERELRLLQFIHHPNIVRLLDVLYQPHTIALVMEFCEGGDLFEELWHHGPLPVALARNYIYQILKGLECFHEKGYAHRDLKPENILIDGKAQVKLCDLGLARSGGADGMMQTLCGTVPYTPPEIVQGLPYDGSRADIWSLGILIFVMATGRLPWESEDNLGMAREIVDGQISFPPEFPSELKGIVRVCTNLNPADRPTASELLASPWLREEQSAYARAFGMAGAQRSSTIGKTSARIILKRSGTRSPNPDWALAAKAEMDRPR
jgi:serine/threonine protein kinase